MSNVETKRLDIGQHTHVEHMPDGSPIGAPVRFEYFRNGCYLTIDQAEALGRELTWAAEKAREVAVVHARAAAERAVLKRRADAERDATATAYVQPAFDSTPSYAPTPAPSYDPPAAAPDPTPSYDGGGGDFGGGGASGEF